MFPSTCPSMNIRHCPLHSFHLYKITPFCNSTTGEICAQFISRCHDYFQLFFSFQRILFNLKSVYLYQRVRACSVAQSCPILCDPMDCSMPGSSVHGIFQARILEWVAISSSMGSSSPRCHDCFHLLFPFCKKSI